MLSRTGEYALRAVLLLAAREDDRPVTAEAIAAELGLPRNYLSKTLHRLVKRGVLRSGRGPRGGFQLARAANRLAVSEVVSEFDAMGPFGRCVLGGRSCDPSHPCTAHERWRWWSGEFARLVDGTTVADFLIRPAEAGGSGGRYEAGGRAVTGQSENGRPANGRSGTAAEST